MKSDERPLIVLQLENISAWVGEKRTSLVGHLFEREARCYHYREKKVSNGEFLESTF